MKRYLLALILMSALAAAQEAPEVEDGAQAKNTASGAAPAAPEAPADEKEIPEEFMPSDELSEDSAVAFPVDI